MYKENAYFFFSIFWGTSAFLSNNKYKEVIIPVKQFKNLTIQDDFMFAKVMTANLELTKKAIEVITERKVEDIQFHKAQYTTNPYIEAKGTRFDVLLEGDDVRYDIEMQVRKQNDLTQRNTYYTSMLVVDSLRKEMSYKELPHIFVIFICIFDPFDVGKERYIASERLSSEGKDITDEVNYNGGYDKIYLNAGSVKPTYTEGNKDLTNFLEYIRNNVISDELTEEMNNLVENTRINAEVELEYMTLEEKLNEFKAEGRKEGIAEGEKKKAIETARNLLLMGKLTNSEIADSTQLSLEEIEKLKQDLKEQNK